MLLFETDRGITQPTKWHRDLCENKLLPWLVVGSIPSLTSSYEFRDRLIVFFRNGTLRSFGQAIAEGHTEAELSSLDGSTVAANASRHHLLNLEQLDPRIEQLKHSYFDVAAAPEPSASKAPIPSATAQVQSDTTVPPQLRPSSPQAAPPTVFQATAAAAQPCYIATTLVGHAQQRRALPRGTPTPAQAACKRISSSAKTRAKPPTKSVSVPPTLRPACEEISTMSTARCTMSR